MEWLNCFSAFILIFYLNFSWEFVKASGKQIICPHVLGSHKWNYEGLKHICGQGAVYLKASNIDFIVLDDDNEVIYLYIIDCFG